MQIFPVIDVTTAIVFAFMLGLGISKLRSNGKGEGLYNIALDFQEIIKDTLSLIIILLLPVYIAGTFANITYSGQVLGILNMCRKNGVTKQIREFVVPLCATIHLAGSIISLMSFSVAILMMSSMNYSLSTMLPFLFILGIAMVAAPGAPGGAVMSALPFLPMIGIPTESGLASLMIALYITQDSFGTAANVSGDNAIAVIIDKINSKLK